MNQPLDKPRVNWNLHLYLLSFKSLRQNPFSEAAINVKAHCSWLDARKSSVQIVFGRRPVKKVRARKERFAFPSQSDNPGEYASISTLLKKLLSTIRGRKRSF